MRYRGGVTAQLATIPERESLCIKVVESLLPQVDKIRLALNNYSFDGVVGIAPEWAKHEKIEILYCDNSLMDGYKFSKADENDGYVLICDDDIIYPPDFREVMVQHLDNFAEPVVLSIMGKNLIKRPMQSYAMGRHEFFRAFEMHTDFRKVELIGMCGAVYHTDYCKINEKHMKVTDSDVCMSVYCNQYRIKKFVVPHAGDWCIDLMEGAPETIPTMWLHNKDEERDRIITDYLNNYLDIPVRGEHGDSFGYPHWYGADFAHDDLGI